MGNWAWWGGVRPLGKCRGHRHTTAQTLNPKPAGVPSPYPSSHRRAVPGRTMRWKAAGERTQKNPAQPWTRERTPLCGGRGRHGSGSTRPRRPSSPSYPPEASEAIPSPNPSSAVGAPRLPARLFLIPSRPSPREQIQVSVQPPQGPPCTLGRREAGVGLSLLGWAWRASEG